MAERCCVMKCRSASHDDHGQKINNGITFHPFPAWRQNEGSQVSELTKRRRVAWVSAVRRKNITFDEIPTSARVCSLHFHSGKPANDMCESDPDWTPSLHLGHSDLKPSDTEQIDRQTNRKRQRTESGPTVEETVAENTTPTEMAPMPIKEEEETGEMLLTVVKQEDESDEAAPMSVTEEEDETGEVVPVLVKEEEEATDETASVPVQQSEEEEGATGGTEAWGPAEKRPSTECDLCESRLAEINRLIKENTTLKCELEKWKMDQQFLKDDNERVKYYTGLPHFQVLIGLLTCIWPHMSHPSRLLSPFQMLFLTLMRLRLDLPIQHMGYLFHVDRRTVCNTFNETICALNARISSMVRWPGRDASNVTVPFQFVEVYGKRVAVILDCFEISTQRPSNLGAEGQPIPDNKDNKNNKTVKYLIGITPQGSVAFFSKGWEGGLSSRQIAENSGILDKLMPGDLSLPASGSDVKDSLGLLCDEIKVPAPAKGSHQMDAGDAEERLKIKNLKIHVKRIIGNIRLKYSMLTAKVPISMVSPCKGEKISILDKTVAVSCALTNMCPNVVEKHKWS